MNTITLKDVGPIELLHIPLKPGFNILTGANDRGKSCAIEAVARLAGGKNEITCRDGASDGYIEGLGVRITVGRSVRRSGQLVALSIESRLPVSTLVDPKIKDPAAADAVRIKCLLVVTGAAADPSLFYGLLGGKVAFDKLIKPEALESDDLVEMAGKIKRAIEAEKRKAEDAAEVEDGQAISDRGAADGLDLTVETDEAILTRNLEDAAGLSSQLIEQAKAAKRAMEGAERAKAQLAKAGASEAVSTQEANERLKSAQDRLAGATQEVQLAKTHVQEIEIELRAAKETYANAVMARETAADGVKAAEEAIAQVDRNKEAMAGWQAAIDNAVNVHCPSEEDLSMASAAVTEARKAIENAAVIRAAKVRLAKAEEHQKAAGELRKLAGKLRDAAKQTDDVLSAAVNSKHMKVRAGRLVTTKDGGKETFYGERSQGTRWKIALDEVAERIRTLGMTEEAIVAAPQEAFESLDHENRKLVHEHAVSLNVCILSAEARGDAIGVEHYSPSEDWKAKP